MHSGGWYHYIFRAAATSIYMKIHFFGHFYFLGWVVSHSVHYTDSMTHFQGFHLFFTPFLFLFLNQEFKKNIYKQNCLFIIRIYRHRQIIQENLQKFETCWEHQWSILILKPSCQPHPVFKRSWIEVWLLGVGFQAKNACFKIIFCALGWFGIRTHNRTLECNRTIFSRFLRPLQSFENKSWNWEIIKNSSTWELSYLV